LLLKDNTQFKLSTCNGQDIITYNMLRNFHAEKA